MIQKDSKSYDVIVVGSGPNGLSAAIVAAQASLRVLLLEAGRTVGGGLRSAELTLPGFVHDICSAIHPMGIASPFFRTLPLERYGLRWVYSPVPIAHPLESSAVLLHRDVGLTGQALGQDRSCYEGLMSPLTAATPVLLRDTLGPLWRWPEHPRHLGLFGSVGLVPAALLSKALHTAEGKALLAGMAAHTILPFHRVGTSAMTLLLAAVAHAYGWPFPQGGAQTLADALTAYFLDLGGELQTGLTVEHLAQLPQARAVLLDVGPRQLLDMAGDRLPSAYAQQLQRYRYGPGVFKVDYALSAPVPWRHTDVAQAATVHLGGSYDEIARAEWAVANGQHPANPFVLAAQHTLFDATRAPEGRHTFWAYCHVPNGSTVDMTDAIEAQVERYAPGFKDTILARSCFHAADYARYNRNYVGGDMMGGQADLRQLLFRPSMQTNSYRTPMSGVYLCSASTPPGGGVHGMNGYFAAQTMLADLGILTASMVMKSPR